MTNRVRDTEVRALRERHATALRRQAEIEGRVAAAREHLQRLEQRMREEFGCGTIDELRERIASEEQGLAAAYSQAEAALARVEAVLQGAEQAP